MQNSLKNKIKERNCFFIILANFLKKSSLFQKILDEYAALATDIFLMSSLQEDRWIIFAGCKFDYFLSEDKSVYLF